MMWPEEATPLEDAFDAAERTDRLIVLLQLGDELPKHQGVPVAPDQVERWEANAERVFIIRRVIVDPAV